MGSFRADLAACARTWASESSRDTLCSVSPHIAAKEAPSGPKLTPTSNSRDEATKRAPGRWQDTARSRSDAMHSGVRTPPLPRDTARYESMPAVRPRTLRKSRVALTGSRNAEIVSKRPERGGKQKRRHRERDIETYDKDARYIGPTTDWPMDKPTERPTNTQG